MTHWAAPGVRCVCVDAAWARELTGLIEGQVYVVQDTIVMTGMRPEGLKTSVAVKLYGVRKLLSNRVTDFFDADRFRPLAPVEQSADVSLFEHLLTGEQVPA